jgi:hypothetical protein
MAETLDSLRAALEDRLRFETLIADLSAGFVNLGPGSGYSADIVALRDIQVTGPGSMQKPYSPEALIRQIRAVLAAE